MHGDHEGAGLFGDAGDGGVSRAGDDRATEELIAVYERAGRTLDDLPYTPEFDRIRAALDLQDEPPRDTLARLQRLRKSGRLPRLGRASTLPVQLHAEESALLERLTLERIETLGQRDQLPYTPVFDAIVDRFNAQTGRSLEHHAVWRMIARLAK
ncbi:MAG: hypothetical protein ACTS3F_13045 [Phycisphaerales bacterium]